MGGWPRVGDIGGNDGLLPLKLGRWLLDGLVKVLGEGKLGIACVDGCGILAYGEADVLIVPGEEMLGGWYDISLKFGGGKGRDVAEEGLGGPLTGGGGSCCEKGEATGWPVDDIGGCDKGEEFGGRLNKLVYQYIVHCKSPMREKD